jgi:iron complex outermembrane receptor protein
LSSRLFKAASPGVLAIAACLALPAAANAQTAGATPPTEEQATTIEEVIVTARRRSETLREVPVSISVLSGADAETRGLARIKDIAASVPNFTISDAGSTNSSTTIVVRGISSNARNAGFEAGVGVYVDGVFTGRPSSFNQDLVDIERIEVLRGPQGTLYGKNTIAGAVNITTVKPGYDLGGQATLEAGNYGLLVARAAVNVPLIDETLAARLSAFTKSRDGYVLNLFNGQHYNDEGAVGGRLQLRWDPAEYARFNASFDALDEDRTLSFPETLDDPSAPGVRTTINDFNPTETRNLWGASVMGDFDLPNGDVLSFITAYRYARTDVANDNDNTAADLLSVAFLDTQRQFSNELRLVSGPDRRLAYALGLYMYDQQADAVHSGIFGTAFPLTGGGRVSIDGVAAVATRSYAAYADLQYDLTSRLSLLGGVRLTHEQKRLQYRQDGALLPGVIFEPIPTLTDRISDNDLSVTARARYKFSPTVVGYARYATGFKSGGWNADFIGSAPIAAARASGNLRFDAGDIDFEPESVANYELGLKGDWFRRRLSANLAVFFMDYRDLQVSQFLGVLNGGTVITNAGRAEISGVELEMNATPHPDLQLNLSLGYLDATFEEYDNCTVGIPSCAGNRLPDAPEISASAGAEYTFSGWSFANVTARVEATYRDSVFATPTNIQRLSIDGYTLLNASVNFQPTGQNWSFGIWGRNLTDEDHLVGVADDDLLGTGRTFGGYGPPRTFGARLQYRY